MRLAMIMTLILGTVAWSQDAASEHKKLNGTWIPTSAELAGQPFPAEVLKTLKLVLDGDKYTVHAGDKLDKGRVKLDLTKKPKAMDIIGEEGPNKGKTFPAIYELDGDTLRVCYNLGGKERPSEFKTEKDKFIFLAIYKRAKS